MRENAETLKTETLKRAGTVSRHQRAFIILIGVWCSSLVVLGLSVVGVAGWLEARGIESGLDRAMGWALVGVSGWTVGLCRKTLKS